MHAMILVLAHWIILIQVCPSEYLWVCQSVCPMATVHYNNEQTNSK